MRFTMSVKFTVVAIVAAAIGGPIVASASVISDGEFSSWTWTVIDPSSATYFNQVQASGGNPGARFYASISANGDNLALANIKQNYTNTAALSGTWTLSMDYLQGPSGTNSIMGVAFVLQQGSNFFYSSSDAVIGSAVWQTKTLSGTFTPASFQAAAGNTGPLSFAAGVQTKFGLMTYLNGSPITYADYFDNWKLDNTNLIVPEPTTLGLLGLGGMIMQRRRRNRFKTESQK